MFESFIVNTSPDIDVANPVPPAILNESFASEIVALDEASSITVKSVEILAVEAAVIRP